MDSTTKQCPSFIIWLNTRCHVLCPGFLAKCTETGRISSGMLICISERAFGAGARGGKRISAQPAGVQGDFRGVCGCNMFPSYVLSKQQREYIPERCSLFSAI